MGTGIETSRRKSLLDQIIDFQERLLSTPPPSPQERPDTIDGQFDNSRAAVSPIASVLARRHAFRACRSISSDKDTPVESCDEEYLASVPGSVEDVLENLGFAPLNAPDIPKRFSSSQSQTKIIEKLDEKDWKRMDYRIMRSLDVCRPPWQGAENITDKTQQLRRMQKIQSLDSDDLATTPITLRSSECLCSSEGDKTDKRPTRPKRFPLVRMATVLSLHGDSSFSSQEKTSRTGSYGDIMDNDSLEKSLDNQEQDTANGKDISQPEKVLVDNDQQDNERSLESDDLSSDSEDDDDTNDNWFSTQQNIRNQMNNDDLELEFNTAKKFNDSILIKRRHLRKMNTECITMDNDDGDEVATAVPGKTDYANVQVLQDNPMGAKSGVFTSQNEQSEKLASVADSQDILHQDTKSPQVRCEDLVSTSRVKRYPLTKYATVEISLHSPVRESKTSVDQKAEIRDYEDNEDILQVAIHHTESPCDSI